MAGEGPVAGYRKALPESGDFTDGCQSRKGANRTRQTSNAEVDLGERLKVGWRGKSDVHLYAGGRPHGCAQFDGNA